MASKLTEFVVGLPGIIFDYAGSAAPNGFLLCYGQAVSRTTYAQLFAVIGVVYGAGDGSTTFNIPDLRGLAIAGADNMGGTAANRLNVNTTGTTTAASALITAIPSTSGITTGMAAYGAALPAGVTVQSVDSASQVTLSTGVGVTAATSGAIRFGIVDGATVGATGGAQQHALATSQLPSHNHGVFLNDPGHTHGHNALLANQSSSTGGGGFAIPMNSGATINSATTGITVRDTTGGGGTANQTAVSGGGKGHPNVQPTIILNKIIKT